MILKFQNREKELALLQRIEQQSLQSAQMTFVVGRRRIGKTTLLKKSVEGVLFLYFFVARKNEALLCDEFTEEIKQKLGVEIYGTLKSFKDVFGYLMELSKTKHFTLIIDEFQEFLSVNPSVYSEMQNLWDHHKDQSKVNLILCGSVYSMMKRVFENSKEPLFGRATNRIHLKELPVNILKEIVVKNNPNCTPEDILAFYMFTGGVAKYIELLVQANAFTFNSMLNTILSDDSIFLEEGKNVLIDEFGKDYGNYFSILSLVAASKTSRTEMESILEMQIGGFLDRLEVDFGIIRKVKPIFSKPNSRSVKYFIQDNFLNFWFRFVYKYKGAVEIGNFKFLKEIVNRDYPTYSGKLLEKYFIDKLSIQEDFSQIGSYWEKGNKNEIDIIAVNEYEKRLVLFEVKRNAKHIRLEELKQKSKSLIQHFSEYSIEYKGLSIGDI